MRCCVPGCSNDSKQISKSQGVTFHVFPTDPDLRKSWLRVIGKERWEPKERSTVCSQHFYIDDLYSTKTGLRKVRTGAVPCVQHQQTCEYGEPSRLKVCRICLVTSGKFYSIKQYKLDQAFENLTGILLSEEDKLPQNLCHECSYRLLNSSKLRRKSLRANTLLLEIIKTEVNISSIDRENNQLVSDLTIKINETNYYDFNIEYVEPELKINDDIDIKNESVFVNDFEDIKEESIHSDRDFVASEKDYSSDDSLPLVTRKKVKTGVKKTGRKKKSVQKPVENAEPKIDRRRKPFLNGDLNETLFTITDLTYEEQIAEIEKRQESANYKNSLFKCTECYKGFLDEDAYNTHVTRHTVQCGEHRCDICKTHFRNQHALRKHTTAHHTQRFSCNQCPYVTTHRQTARLHERWHKGTKYQCPHCQDEFVKFTTYMGHIRIKHPSDFVCQLCGYSFVSEKGIELHKKLKHRLESSEIPEDGPYCELCDVRFASSAALRRHVSVSARHNGSDKTGKEANKPKKSRRTKEMLERDGVDLDKDGDDSDRRFSLRKAEGPIPCEQCGMQLEDSRAYHGHFRRAHPDKNRTNYPSMKTPSMCELCGRMFQSYALLKDHTWTHTGERPFKCEACGKAFRMKQRLVAHRRVHSQVKATYVCSMCGKHFSTHSNRQRHMFIHTGLKPFKCEMCGKSFKHVSEKRAHITYVHLKKPWPKRARGKRRPDGRQSPLGNSMQPEMDMVQPIWPPCDPKMPEISNIIEDKPMYYNLKI